MCEDAWTWAQALGHGHRHLGVAASAWVWTHALGHGCKHLGMAVGAWARDLGCRHLGARRFVHWARRLGADHTIRLGQAQVGPDPNRVCGPTTRSYWHHPMTSARHSQLQVDENQWFQPFFEVFGIIWTRNFNLSAPMELWDWDLCDGWSRFTGWSLEVRDLARSTVQLVFVILGSSILRITTCPHLWTRIDEINIITRMDL